MKASALLTGTEYQLLSGCAGTEVSGVSRDNRKAAPGDLFICTAGARFDTHDDAVIQALYENGIRVFVAEKEIHCPEDATVFLVKNTRIAATSIYGALNGYPAEKMTMIGITGSKGKTTTTHMLAEILRAAGHKVGTIGTNGAMYADEAHELANTTPDYDELQMYLRKMVESGCDTAVIEVSSQGMKMHRADGFVFDYAVWLNIQEGDHIGPNEHESFEDYMFCKAELLNHARVRLAYRDDPFRDAFIRYVNGPVEWFGSSEDCDYRATDIEKTFDEETGLPGIRFHAGGRLDTEIRSNFPGTFNTWNALAACAVADHMGATAEQMNRGLANVHIKGRDDIVYRGPKFSVCVDFAHNGASTWSHLTALREYRPRRLVCVFGADGNRSKGRRYGMGEAAGTLADFSIVTSGHNRWETFEQILADTEVGLHKAPHPNYIAIKDRREAIRYAIEHAEEGDLITIIGLGHETWQEEMGVKRHHSDTEYVQEVLRSLGLIE